MAQTLPSNFFFKDAPARAAVAAAQAGVSAGQLERALPGLGAAVAEEGAVQPGEAGQAPRQLCLVGMIEKVGDVDQFARLPLQGARDGGMAVAQGVHPDAAEEVEITPPPGVVEIDAVPAGEEHGQAVVGGQQQLRLGALDLGQAHADNTSVPQSSLAR
jgi:hypothetical protein